MRRWLPPSAPSGRSEAGSSTFVSSSSPTWRTAAPPSSMRSTTARVRFCFDGPFSAGISRSPPARAVRVGVARVRVRARLVPRLGRGREVAEVYEAAPRRVVAQGRPARPHVLVHLRLALGRDLRVALLPARGDDYLALKVSPVELDARGLEAVQDLLRGVAVAVGGARRDDGHLELAALEKVLRRGVLRAVVPDLQDVRAEVDAVLDEALALGL